MRDECKRRMDECIDEWWMKWKDEWMNSWVRVNWGETYSIWLWIDWVLYGWLYASVSVCMHICMYVRMYACKYVCTYVCLQACMHILIDGWTDGWINGWIMEWMDGGMIRWDSRRYALMQGDETFRNNYTYDIPKCSFSEEIAFNAQASIDVLTSHKQCRHCLV